jgi:CheY-like chemotaxis protein
MQPETPPPDLRRELIGRLADGVAHDAANLLAVARLVGESLVTRDDLPEDVVAKLTTLTKAVHEAGELLHQLSAVSGRRPAVAHAVALDALLAELTPLLRAALGGRPIEISGSAVAFADRAEIEAAVVGLVLHERRGSSEPALAIDVVPDGNVAAVVVGSREARFPILHRGGIVLVVEDDPDLRALVRDALAAGGFDVVAVGDADAARSAMEMTEGRVQLLVTDVELPGSSGLDLAALVIDRGVPVVVMSGHRESALADEIPKGVVVLDKPFGVPQLVERVRLALGDTE